MARGPVVLLVLAAAAPAQDGAPSGADAPPGLRPAPAVAGASDFEGADVPLAGTNEPTVVVNPTDPRNVAMASLFASRVSTDGGATWTAELLAPTPFGHERKGDPSLAFDGQGRLFWTYLTQPKGLPGQFDLVVTRLDPDTGAPLAGYPVNITDSLGLGAADDFLHDKQWLAADRDADGPFADRLYLVWTEFFFTGEVRILASTSSDQGLSWTAPVELSDPSEGFVWPSHVAVAPNGDVYAAYHAQTGFTPPGVDGVGNPDGVSGQVLVCRSTDGGATWPQKTVALAPGDADVTYNVQSAAGALPGAAFWMQGSPQPWVLPDPFVPGRVSIVTNDDPDDLHGAGDDADVVIARSDDFGLTWSAPTQVDDGPGDAFAVMPTAAIDPTTGCIAVHWYDNRAGATNGDGRFLLDVHMAVSTDGGLTWPPSVALNDAPFDPDLGAPVRWAGPPETLRVGEYNGVDMLDGSVHAVWCGNDGSGQQSIADSVPCACGLELTCETLASGTPGCCLFEWTLTNGRSAPLTGFRLDVEAGSGAMLCAALGDVDPPDGFAASFDLPWGGGPPSNRAVIAFTGGSIPSGGSATGTLLIDVNGPSDTPVLTPGWSPFAVPAFGLHVHATASASSPGPHVDGEDAAWGAAGEWVWTPWATIGPALDGTDGPPVLTGDGVLLPATPATLELVNGFKDSTTTLVIGLVPILAPFKGGVFGPSPDLLVPGLPVDAQGELTLSARWPQGVPSGARVLFQHWIADPGGPKGLAASNTLQATTP